MSILKYISRPLPTLAVVLTHLTGALVSFAAAVLYAMGGLEWWSSFYSMATCVWVMTLGFRLIDRYQNRGKK